MYKLVPDYIWLGRWYSEIASCCVVPRCAIGYKLNANTGTQEVCIIILLHKWMFKCQLVTCCLVSLWPLGFTNNLVKTIMIMLYRATVFCLIYVNSMYMYRKAFTRRQVWAHFVPRFAWRGTSHAPLWFTSQFVKTGTTGTDNCITGSM